jgi:hypothetical protein
VTTGRTFKSAYVLTFDFNRKPKQAGTIQQLPLL